MAAARFYLATAAVGLLLCGCSAENPALTYSEHDPLLRPQTFDRSGYRHDQAVYQRYLALRGMDLGGGAGFADSRRTGADSSSDSYETYSLPLPGAGGGLVAYDPTVSVVATGSVLDAEATVSADRRYVTITTRPQNTQILGMFTYYMNVTSVTGT